MKHGSLFSGIDFNKAKALYESGMTQKEVGEVFGVSQKVMWRVFERNGYKCRVAAKRNQRGENNSSWRWNNATYAACHYRVKKAKGKANHCEQCGRSDVNAKYDWANLTGNFADINDYKSLCRSCHWKMDGHSNNFPNRRKRPMINKRKEFDAKQ